MKTNFLKRGLSAVMAILMVLSCWVWMEPNQIIANAANEQLKDHYLFAYFTGTSKEGQTIHLAVSDDGLNYQPLRGNEPVIIPSKGVGAVRDPYIWYNAQDNYYYVIATDLDFTDTGSIYSENSESYMIWRSKDLINWYDETFIDVKALLARFGQNTNNMLAVWAPQILWDGSAYMVYFSLRCDATGGGYKIVYFRTTDLLNPDAYFEYNVLNMSYNNWIIDGDIIYNPSNGLYYIFYKNEDKDYNSGLKTVHYLVSENGPYGPYTANSSYVSNIDSYGGRVYPSITKNLEGVNSFFDNSGKLITFTDNYDNDKSTFYVSSSSDFKTFTMLDTNTFNLNDVSPRHGSVVKITADEYNRLLDNSYLIRSSSFGPGETLSDYLVAKLFTTSDLSYNAATGSSVNFTTTDGSITATQNSKGEWQANFSAGGAEINLANVIPEDFSMDEGFTITFKATVPSSNGSNVRIFDISNNFSQRTNSDECYLHMSPVADSNGAYVGTFNGQTSMNNWIWASSEYNLNDGKEHEYIISAVDGNIIMYVDGIAVAKSNRHCGVTYNDRWYQEISNSVMRLGKSEWHPGDPLLTGQISDFCIYSRALSYYDVMQAEEEVNVNIGWIDGLSYSGIPTQVPTFQNTDAARMQSLPNASEHFSNILYTSNTVKNYDGNNMSADSATCTQISDLWVALYYPETTVLLFDGVNDAIMPVSFGYYCETSNRKEKGFYNVYPTAGPGSTADLGELEISMKWAGWYRNGDYYECIVKHEDGYIGNNSTTSSWSQLGVTNANRNAHYGAPLKVNAAKIDFGGSGYKLFNLTWQIYGNYKQNGSERNTHTANITSDNAIYVIDFKSVLDIRNSLTKSAYDSIMNNAQICSALKEKYAAAVYTIQTLDPTRYDYARATERSVHACGKAISEAVNTYNGVMEEIAKQSAQGTYGHSLVVLEGHEATCAAAGVTEGSYCAVCGETIVEQQVISQSLNHNYVTHNANSVKCTVCGLVVSNMPNEIRYQNMFSFNGWASSISKNIPGSAALNLDYIEGTIKLTNNASSGEVYTAWATDASTFTKTYHIPVQGNTLYGFEFDSDSADAEVLVFEYTDTNGGWSVIAAGGIAGNNLHAFTTSANAKYLEFRFDNNKPGTTATFSNIGLYDLDGYTKVASQISESRLAYYIGDNKPLLESLPSPEAGYVFDGWYTADGVKVENTRQGLPSSVVVYPRYKNISNVTFDNLIDFSIWSKSAGNGTVTDVTDIGMTINSNSDAGESTSSSPFFNVTPGEEYEISMDIIGDNWDVYIFFCDANGNWVEFVDGPSNRYSSNRTANAFEKYGNRTISVFKAPSNSAIVKAQIRLDANGASNSVRFENIRVSAVSGIRMDTVNKMVAKDSAYGTLPVPTRSGYEFAGWFDANGNKVTASTIFTSIGTVYLTSKWIVTDEALSEDFIVVDFGMPATFNPIDNDAAIKNDASFKLLGISTTASSSPVAKLSGAYGTFTVNGNNVTYTPSIIMSGLETAYYYVSDGTTTVKNYIIVMPATVVYYEDSFADSGVIDYQDGVATSGNTGKWASTGNSTLGGAAINLADTVYGYSSVYADSKTDLSMGSAHVVSVSQYNNPQKKYNGVAENAASWPVAQFTFAGTGFDIVSLISNNTGAIEVIVTDASGKKIYDWIVDTYYGYSYDTDAKDWFVDTTDSSALYQIPVISRNDLAYGTYTVQIIPTYSSKLDHQKDGSYDFYLDAIRVYNPMGNDPDAASIYASQGEYVLSHQNIRDILVSAGKLDVTNAESAVVYISKNTETGDYTQYSTSGPKNEVYLAKGQQIAFNLSVKGTVPTSVQISAHTVSGSPVMVFGSAGSNSGSTAINHKTALYYKAPFVGEGYWTYDSATDTYTTAKPIVISNSGEGILSLCNIKVTSDGASAAQVLYVMDDKMLSAAAATADNLAALDPDAQALFVPDELGAEAGDEVVEIGETVVVSIETSAEVYALTVNGENAVLVSVNDNGTKTWNYTYTTTSRGEATFTLVAYNSDGFMSEETTVTVDVQSKIEIFFTKLTHFFRMIIDFLDNLF